MLVLSKAGTAFFGPASFHAGMGLAGHGPKNTLVLKLICLKSQQGQQQKQSLLKATSSVLWPGFTSRWFRGTCKFSESKASLTAEHQGAWSSSLFTEDEAEELGGHGTSAGAHSSPATEPGLDPFFLSPTSGALSTNLCPPCICQGPTVYQVYTVEKTH